MSIAGLIDGTRTELVGVEENGDGALRLYLGHRSRGVYALVYDDEVKAKVRGAWAGGRRVTVPMPRPEQMFRES